MFAKTIVLSDAFLDMPLSARCLYFTLGMLADDDGFVNSPKSVMRQCGATIDDLKVLLAKRYILDFEDGVIVIKHWRINNYLQKDRLNPTVYVEHKDTLLLDEKGAYKRKDGDVYTEANSVYTQDRLGKDRLGKDNIELDSNILSSKESVGRAFRPPTLEEVRKYCSERNNGIDPQHFIDYYSSNGWRVGKSSMKDWKAAVRNWERNGYSGPKKVVDTLPRDEELDKLFGD